jgi:hypothetical protein
VVVFGLACVFHLKIEHPQESCNGLNSNKHLNYHFLEFSGQKCVKYKTTGESFRVR